MIHCQIHISPAVATINIESVVDQISTKLTTTNNQFKLEESLIQKVFEASGYMMVNLISLLKRYLKHWDIKILNL